METERGDIIDLFRSFRGKKESNNNICDEDALLSANEGMTLAQMTALGMGLLLAGSEAVHDLVDFAIHSLSLHPEHQRKIRVEVQDAMKNNGVSDFNFQVVRDLSFTFQCLFEAARLYPGNCILMRQFVEDFHIPSLNCTLRKGDRVLVPLYSIARDETHFQDPHIFNPERFRSKNLDLNIPETLLSFGTGQRKCPGYRNGMIVAAAILASIVYKYDIEPSSHSKQMDASEFKKKGISTSPGRNIVVNISQVDNLDIS